MISALRILLSLFLCSAAYSSIELSLGYHSSQVQPNQLSETLIGSTPLTRGLELRGGMNLSQSASELEQFQYMVELAHTLISPLSIFGRWHQLNQVSTSSHLKHLLLGSTLSTTLGSVNSFVSVGWYKRFQSIQNSPILPSLGSDYSEQDFALALGTTIFWTERLSQTLRIATFEELEVYNLNHPFAELKVSYQLGNDLPTVFTGFRYQVLLGFGRLDEWRTLVGAVWGATPPPSN